MRRIQLNIDEDVDDLLEVETARSGRSKSALIRQAVTERYRVTVRSRRDALAALVGSLDFEHVDLDEVVYDR